MNTKRILTLVLLAAAINTNTLFAQQADTSAVLAAKYFHEAEQTGAKQTIWPAKLYGPMFFVDNQTRQVWANMPDKGGILKPAESIYEGVLPQSVIIANTSVEWGGRRWSMILWPLPQDHDDRLSLVLHESFHRIQPELHMPVTSPTADHLDTRDGRIYFFLELEALKSALNKPVNQRKEDLRNALIFREKRKLLFPKTFANEAALEGNEALAEYTGVILGRSHQTMLNYLATLIDKTEKKKSLIRSFPYTTGPVYGYLAYNVDTAWTRKIDSSFTFPGVVAQYYHIKTDTAKVGAEAEKLADKYDGKRIIAAENERQAQFEKQTKYYTELFAQKPVLVINLQHMHIGFNPSILFDLGKYGTVYPTMTLEDTWGELLVTSGDGALMKDWHIVYVPVSKPIMDGDIKTLEGEGWKLKLAEGWKIVVDGKDYKVVH